MLKFMIKGAKYKVLGDEKWYTHHVILISYPNSDVYYYHIPHRGIVSLKLPDLKEYFNLYIENNFLKNIFLNKEFISYMSSDNLKIEGISVPKFFRIEFKC